MADASPLLSTLWLAAAMAVAAPPVAALPPSQEAELASLRARDDGLSFTVRSAALARHDLEAGPGVPSLRATALMTLGCAGDGSDVPLLARACEEDSELERYAAVLALGELGATGGPALVELADDALAGVEDAFALALARSGTPAALERLRQRVPDATPAAGSLADLPDTEAARGLLELRYRAARRYGLVNGRKRRAVLLFELLADEEFLDRLVLGAAALERTPVVLEHLGELVRGERQLGAGALRVAASVLPDELARRIAAGELQPSQQAWADMLDEIEFQRAQTGARRLLELAFEHPGLEGQAGRLLVAAGGELPEGWLERRLVDAEPAERARLCTAIGERGEPELAELAVPYWADDPDAGVRASALVALRRLGDDEAVQASREVLAGTASELRDATLTAMSRVPHDREVLTALREASRSELSPEVRFEVDLALASQGVLDDTTRLRNGAFLDRAVGRRREVVRALSDRPSEEDVALLTDLFPLEGSPGANVDMAILLVGLREPLLFDFLRRAMWTADWNQSVLAGGLLVRSRGLHGVIDELLSPPPGATEEDHRRVGFALGQWGGLRAVESLARRRAGGDAALQGAYLGALSALGR